MLCFTWPAHHSVFHSLLVQQIDSTAEFTQADPVEPCGGALKCGGGLFADSNHSHFYSPAARALEHEERKIAVSGDEPPSPGCTYCVRGH